MSDMDQRMDDIFRDRLKEHDAGAPMHLWANIVRERGVKKRYGLWFFLKSGTLLLALLAGGWIGWSQMTTDTHADVGSTENLVQLEAAEQTSRTGESTEALEANAPATAESATKVSETSALEQAASGAPEDGANNFVSTGKPQKTDLSTENASLENQQVLSGANDEFTDKGIVPGYIPGEEHFVPTPEEAFDASLKKEEFLQTEKATEEIPSLEAALLELTPEESFTPGKCVSFEDPNWQTYLDVYFSPDVAIRTLSAKGSIYAPYAELRGQENATFAFTTGLRWNVVSPRGLGIRVGAQYAQIGELFSHVDPDAVKESIINNYDDQGNLISSDTSYIYGDKIYEIHNYYRMLDVPVMIGYEWEFDRVTFTAYGGMIANLWFGKKGRFFAPDMESIVEFTDGQVDAYPAYNRNLSAHFGASFGLQYTLSENLYMLFEPHFRYFPQSITREDYPLNQKYFVSGISMGLRYAW
ncbi:MAG: hypothetical protein GYB31_18055 [Bacteroidetes bacterium]|nr:hypothetical protein [Bacteroidota bacterium]